MNEQCLLLVIVVSLVSLHGLVCCSYKDMDDTIMQSGCSLVSFRPGIKMYFVIKLQ